MKALIAVLALFGSTAFASVSGYTNSVSQLTVVMAADEVAAALRGQPILNIGAGKALGSWTVTSEHCTADVYLIAKIPDHPGPVTYTLDGVKNVICR